jgi:hypothetical protein
MLAIFLENFLSPPILFFVLGLVAGRAHSDLDISENIGRVLSLYLMMAIGFKGGHALAISDGIALQALATMGMGIVLGFIQPVLGYAFLQKTPGVSRTDAIAIAAHYGSISIVTFIAASAFLKNMGIGYAGYVVALAALMEAPAIAAGTFLGLRTGVIEGETAAHQLKVWKKVASNGAILLLVGSFIIGAVTGQAGYDRVEGLLVRPFDGLLCLFLLKMGLTVARQGDLLKNFSWSLLGFGLYMPLMGAGLGLLCAWALHLDPGTGLIFVVLAASASYIAVPAAMRLVLPQANPGLSIPLAMGVTFPFNVLVGIPIYFDLCQKVLP